MKGNLELSRREFLNGAVGAAIGSSLLGCAGGKARAGGPKRRVFQISLAAWSLHRSVFGGQLKMIDAPRLLREEFGIGGLEFVNTMLEVPTGGYVRRMRAECEKHAVKPLLIMCDDEGSFAHPDPAERRRAVRNHLKWIRIAADLGCHSIRVNWVGATAEEITEPAKTTSMIRRSAETFTELVEHADDEDINVIIENHGGPSSQPEMLARLMQTVDSPRFDTLPDFGNFPQQVDRYDGIDKMMPHAKAVSAKCYDFDAEGNETKIDFERMIQICVDQHGYDGWIGIEYEGSRLSEYEGIRAARDLLIRLRG